MNFLQSIGIIRQWNLPKKSFKKCWHLTSYEPQKKLGDFVFCSVWKPWNYVCDWIRTRDLARLSRVTYPLYQISLWIFFEKKIDEILRHFYNLSVAWQSRQSNWSTIGDFYWKDKKTRIVNKFWSKSNFCMKFSILYEKVHHLPDFGRIFHEKVVPLKLTYTNNYKPNIFHDKRNIWLNFGRNLGH